MFGGEREGLVKLSAGGSSIDQTLCLSGRNRSNFILRPKGLVRFSAEVAGLVRHSVGWTGLVQLSAGAKGIGQIFTGGVGMIKRSAGKNRIGHTF